MGSGELTLIALADPIACFRGIFFVACECEVEADGDGEQAEIPDHGVVVDDVNDVFVE
jgi:hypothetical protein